jgi:short-subunit dehydrogenase
VSVVCPGLIDTPMKDRIKYVGVDRDLLLERLRDRFSSAESCAEEIVAGVARNDAVIVVTALARWAQRAYRLAPRLVDRIVAREVERLRAARQKSAGGD